MGPRRLCVTLGCLIVGSAIAAPSLVGAQGVTAQVEGSVTDEGGGRVPGATVTLTNKGTNWTRRSMTGPDGRFAFVDLLAGTYDLAVTLDGFKTARASAIAVGSTEHVTVTPIVLEVGEMEETVTVRRDAALVQTTTAARSGLITRENFEEIGLKGRDFTGLISLQPGVIDTNPREAPGWTLQSGLSVNGRTTGITFTYDGITNKETGSNATNHAAPGLDSIAEVRVQSSNFQAEYGRSSGAAITVITRSGTSAFRGSAAFFKRDDALNGNEFARKDQCRHGDKNTCNPPLYRFDNFAWTLGGPILLPGTDFNRARNRLFFFWSQDLLARTDPGVLNQRRMPTALERNGDFSQTLGSNHKLVFIRDPGRDGTCNSATGGPACFPGNVIPANRIDATASALLNMFPLPNATDPSGGNLYNYTFQTVQDWPRNDQVLRLDWNVTPRTTVYGRFQFGHENRIGPNSLAFTAGWPQMYGQFVSDSISYVTTLLRSFGQSTFVEATAGVNWGYQYASPLNQAALDANTRSKVLPSLPQFFPNANPLDLLPNAMFNLGIPGTIGAFMYERRFPYYGFNTLWNFSGSLTRIKGRHNVKAGVFVEHTTRPVRQRSVFNGTINFSVDPSNPLNTNIGFGNALLGAITSYQKADAQPSGHGRFVNTEFYAQDNWRLKRGFTLDMGVRFYVLTPTSNLGGQVAQFEPNDFDPNAAPLLFQPITVPEGRRAVNPLSGEIFPSVYIGRLVPDSGNFINGTRVYAGTSQFNSPFEVAPRVGFAWDVTGDGKTAIRAGAGAFYDRYADNDLLELAELPPLVRTYTTNYTTIPELLASPLTETPTAARRIEEFVAPVVYNWSVGVQREVGWKLVSDAAYVGNAARRQPITRELNGRPYGYAYQRSNLDMTNIQGGQAQPLPDDLLRPYRGYGSITQRQFTGYSDYHSLQMSVTRRRSSDGLSFGAAYTYQIVNKTLGAIDPFVPDNRARNYNSAGRRPHTLTIHYSWLVPNVLDASRPPVLRVLAHDWQFSGVTTFLSGAQGGFSYVYTGVPTGTLTGTGSIGGGPSRPSIVCDPTLPRSDRTPQRQFRTECIVPPDDAWRLGNARGDEWHGPGYINWDISAFKQIRMGGTTRLQLRVELYNAFNTYQWTGVNTNAEFNYSTGVLTNPNVFGALTGATNSARRIQLGARLTF